MYTSTPTKSRRFPKLKFFKRKSKPIIFQVFVDCLGCVTEQSVLGRNTLTDREREQMLLENPNRSLTNQKATRDYFKLIDNYLVQNEVELYLFGTTGEVASFKAMLSPSVTVTKEYSAPLGEINNATKWRIIRKYERQSKRFSKSVKLVKFATDDGNFQVYRVLQLICGSKVELMVVPRKVDQDEVSNFYLKLAKTIFRYFRSV